MLVRDFKEQEGYRFPEEFLNLLPEVCFNPDCNAPTEMTEVLTSLRCSDPRCPSKLAMRLLAIFRDLGIKGVGAEKAKSFIKHFGITNPATVFAYEYEEDGCFEPKTNEKLSRDLEQQLNSKKTFTLPELIKICQLPNIQSSASKIFDGYLNLSDAYRDIEQGGVDFIREKLGIKKGESDLEKEVEESAKRIFDYIEEFKDNVGQVIDFINEDEYQVFIGFDNVQTVVDLLNKHGITYIKDKIRNKRIMEGDKEISIRALKVYETLMLFKTDLFEAVEYVNIINPQNSEGMKILKVVCSTEVGAPFSSKADFYAHINNKYSDVVHVNFEKSFTKSLDYVVWSGGSQFDPSARLTNKVKSAVKNNNIVQEKITNGEPLKDGEHYIPVVNAREFMQILDSFRED